MKAKKKVLSLFLVVALLAVGIGYATVTDILTVNGTVQIEGFNEVQTFDENVFFSRAIFTASNPSADVTAEGTTPSFTHTPTDSNIDTITLTIPKGLLLVKGDTVTATVTISNSNSVEANIALTSLTETLITVSGTTSTPLVSCKCEWVLNANHTIPAKSGGTNGTVEVKFTFTLENTPTLHGVQEGNISATFTATKPETP